MRGELPEQLRRYLGINNHLTLFRVDDRKHLRKVFRNAPRKDEAGYQPVVAFQDAVGYHELVRC